MLRAFNLAFDAAALTLAVLAVLVVAMLAVTALVALFNVFKTPEFTAPLLLFRDDAPLLDVDVFLDWEDTLGLD